MAAQLCGCLGTPAIFVEQTDLSYLYLGGPQGIGLHEVQCVHGTCAQNQRTQVAHRTGDLGWQENQVILHISTSQLTNKV